MAKIHIHVHKTKDANPYASAAAKVRATVEKAINEVSSFSEKAYKETGDENAINALYHLREAARDLSKVR